MNDSHIYKLMHKDQECGLLQLDEHNEYIRQWKLLAPELAPFRNEATTENIRHWWRHRAIPGSRKLIKEMVNNIAVNSNLEYLAMNLALSISDTYWIKPIELDLTWEDVNLFDNASRPVPYHNQSTYSPNASLGGEMDKYWDIKKKDISLVKISSRYFGQQSINEEFATLLHERQKTDVPFTKYTTESLSDGSISSRCSAFTSSGLELIPAYEVLNSQKQNSNLSIYEQYISTCIYLGVDEEIIRSFMDYQTITDFIICNTDEHLYNFGLLRDSDNNRFTGPAPIYDSGNSMLYETLTTKPLKRSQLLGMETAGMYNKAEKILKQVTDKMIVKTDLLPETAEVTEFYEKRGVPGEYAAAKALSYENAVRIIDEYQHGKKISLYSKQ